MDINGLVAEIKKNKKYKDISDEIVKQRATEYIRKNPNFDGKIAVKDIRKSLHKAHGSFRGYSKEIKEKISRKEYKETLKANRSTRERLDSEIYEDIYSKIFEITGKPVRILDLGCGINPVSIPFMGLEWGFEYYAYDINDAEITALNDFFKIERINGTARVLDLSNIENIDLLEKNIDVCFMFKVIDVLEEEKKGHKYAEEMIKKLAKKCKFIVVSFSTRTLSGKAMGHPYRGWIERMLERIKLEFEVLDLSDTAGEVFYIIKSNV